VVTHDYRRVPPDSEREPSDAECHRSAGVFRWVVLFLHKWLTAPCPSTGTGSWILFCQRGGPNMKKSLITIISALCIVATPATMA
jgi:hypothetical protein